MYFSILLERGGKRVQSKGERGKRKEKEKEDRTFNQMGGKIYGNGRKYNRNGLVSLNFRRDFTTRIHVRFWFKKKKKRGPTLPSS